MTEPRVSYPRERAEKVKDTPEGKKGRKIRRESDRDRCNLRFEEGTEKRRRYQKKDLESAS